jgi:origin recognition complex subunit 1
MSVTPRRSTRGVIFSPSPFSTPHASTSNTTYNWLSAPISSSHSSYQEGRTSYTSYSRVTTKPRRKGEDESRFHLGVGVIVSVEGGGEGVGILIGLWEEEVGEDDEDSQASDEGRGEEDDGDGEKDGDVEDGPKTRKLAEVHWCFRKQDLPSVMKNLQVADVSAKSIPDTRYLLISLCTTRTYS